MGDQTNKPESPVPRNSHKNARLSTGTQAAESAVLRPARTLKRGFPWRPTKGGVSIRSTKRTVSACPSLQVAQVPSLVRQYNHSFRSPRTKTKQKISGLFVFASKFFSDSGYSGIPSSILPCCHGGHALQGPPFLVAGI